MLHWPLFVLGPESALEYYPKRPRRRQNQRGFSWRIPAVGISSLLKEINVSTVSVSLAFRCTMMDPCLIRPSAPKHSDLFHNISGPGSHPAVVQGAVLIANLNKLPQVIMHYGMCRSITNSQMCRNS